MPCVSRVLNADMCLTPPRRVSIVVAMPRPGCDPGRRGEGLRPAGDRGSEAHDERRGPKRQPPLGEILPRRPGLGRTPRHRAALPVAGRCGGPLRRPAGAGLHGPHHHLPYAGRAGGLCGGGLPEARRRQGPQGRPAAPQLPRLRHRLFRRSQGRRNGGELQPALCHRGNPQPGGGFRDRHPRYARPLDPLRQGARRARAHPAHPYRGLPDGRDAALPQEPPLPPGQAAGGRRRAEGFPACLLQDTDGERRQTDPGGDGPGERHRGAAIHRRHHRHLQGRDAEPRQSLRQHHAGGDDAADGRQGRRGHAGRAAALPCVRHDGGDELQPSYRRAHRAAAPLRARCPAGHHRQEAADALSRRAHHLYRHQRPSGRGRRQA